MSRSAFTDDELYIDLGRSGVEVFLLFLLFLGLVAFIAH